MKRLNQLARIANLFGAVMWSLLWLVWHFNGEHERAASCIGVACFLLLCSTYKEPTDADR